MNSRIISGKVKKIPSSNVSSTRYDFLSLGEAEPDLGVPAGNAYILAANTDGTRYWTINTGGSGDGVSGYSGYSGVSPESSPWINISENYSASSGDKLIANTSNGSFSITLPSSPSVGDFVKLIDPFNWGINNLTIVRNGSTIEKIDADLTIDISNIFVDLIYDGITWQVISAVGTSGFSGISGYSGSGISGYSGFGLSGYSGYSGSGISGYSGYSGESGYSGYSGESGYSGYSGLSLSLVWLTKTSNYTANVADRIFANTDGGSFTITLPSTPSNGDFVVIADSFNWNANNLIVGRNGNTIENSATDLILDVQGVSVELIYNGTTWQVIASIAPAGISGASGYSGTRAVTSPRIVTSNYTLSAPEWVYCNTANGQIELLLPATPDTQNTYYTISSGAYASSNNVIIGRNTSTIMGLAEDMTIDRNNISIDLLYDGTTWRIA